MKTSFWILVVLLTTGPASAMLQDEASSAVALNQEASEAEPDSSAAPARLALLPIIFSGPDTGYAVGLLPQYVFQTSGDARHSNLRADLYYTQKKQFNFQFTPELWLPGNSSSIRAKLQYRDWPNSFYGAEPPAFEESEGFNERLLNVSVEMQRRLLASAYVGFSYRFRWANVAPDSAASQLATSGLRGVGTSWMSGIGVVTSWDSRNHVYLPTSGILAKLSAEWYTTMLGSDNNFGLFSAEIRGYRGLSDRYSVAGQLKLSSMLGSGPFRLHPNIGEVLRGYGSSRHVGKNRWAAQVEFRAIPVAWRFGFVVFAGVGDAATRWREFGGDLWYTAGFGVRFLAYQSLKITIRQDFGFGRDSMGDYLDLNEAF